ncbi:MAG: fasciclin domain-containing protein [Myxococcota bacterium]
MNMGNFKLWAALSITALGIATTVACGDDEDGTVTPVPNTGGSETTTPGTGGEGGEAPGLGTIVELAAATDDLSTLVTAVSSADVNAAAGINLAEALSGEGPFTVFAPNNAAFAALDEADETLDLSDGISAGEEANLVAAVLLYHVVLGNIASSALADTPFTNTLSITDGVAGLTGPALVFDTSGDAPRILHGGDAAEIAMADVQASNGVVHIVDTVLLPPTIAQLAGHLDNLSTLLTAITDPNVNAGDETLNLGQALGGEGTFTVFAPTNEAFTAFDERIPGVDLTDGINAIEGTIIRPFLEYHVASSGIVGSGELATTRFVDSIRRDGASIVFDLSDTANPAVWSTGDNAGIATADVYATNGVIHVIDEVIEPGNIGEVATWFPELSTLVETLVTEVSVLQSLDPVMARPFDFYTVFAPSNEAFDAADQTVDGSFDISGLPANLSANLDTLLEYHVIEATGDRGNPPTFGDVVEFAELSSFIDADIDTLAGARPATSLSITEPMAGTFEIVDTSEDNAGFVEGFVDIRTTNGIVHVIDKVLIPVIEIRL